MKLLYKYIFKEHLVPFLLSLSVLILILLAQFLLKNMTKFLGRDIEIRLLFELMYYNMAWVVALAVPMAVLVSTLMAFGRMSSDNEIAAMRSSGITYFSMISPALIFATIVSAIMIYFNNWILPNMNYKARNLITNIYKTRLDIDFTPGALYDKLDGYIFYFESKKDKKYYNATIIKHNNRDILKTITSNSAELIENYNDDIIEIKLDDGYVYENSKNKDEYRIIEFEKNIIRLDISKSTFQRKETRYKGDRELIFDDIKIAIDSLDKMITNTKKYIESEINFIIDSTSAKLNNLQEKYPELKKNIKASTFSLDEISSIQDSTISFINNIEKKLPVTSTLKNMDRKSIEKLHKAIRTVKRGIKHHAPKMKSNIKLRDKYLVELHKKFSIPIASIVFILIGAPLGIMARRGKFPVSIAISMIFFLIYWAFLIGGEEFADKGELNPILSMWLPNIVLLLIGLFLNFKVSKQQIFRFPQLFKWNKKTN